MGTLRGDKQKYHMNGFQERGRIRKSREEQMVGYSLSKSWEELFQMSSRGPLFQHSIWFIGCNLYTSPLSSHCFFTPLSTVIAH